MLSQTMSRSGRTVKRNNFFDDIKEGEQHLRSDLRSLGETGKIDAKSVQEKDRSFSTFPPAPSSAPPAPQRRSSPVPPPAAPKPSTSKPAPPMLAAPNQVPAAPSQVKETQSVYCVQPSTKPATAAPTTAQRPPVPASLAAMAQKPAPAPLSITIPIAGPAPAASASSNPLRHPSATTPMTPVMTPTAARKAVASSYARRKTSASSAAAGPAPLDPLSVAAAAAANGGIPVTPQVKAPRRKPGARECMQISRRFGPNVIPQRYMDILSDYCTRGKVEHLIRMRERLDDHSRFLEHQLAGLEALVLKKGELTVTVPPAEPEADTEDSKMSGATGGIDGPCGGFGGMGGAGAPM